MVQVPYPSGCEEPFVVLVCAAIPPERPGACARRRGMESHARGVVTLDQSESTDAMYRKLREIHIVTMNLIALRRVRGGEAAGARQASGGALSAELRLLCEKVSQVSRKFLLRSDLSVRFCLDT